MHLLLDGGVLTLDPLTFDFASGKLSGAVKIDARKDVPVTDVDARLSNIHLEQFVHGSRRPWKACSRRAPDSMPSAPRCTRRPAMPTAPSPSSCRTAGCAGRLRS